MQYIIRQINTSCKKANALIFNRNKVMTKFTGTKLSPIYKIRNNSL